LFGAVCCTIVGFGKQRPNSGSCALFRFVGKENKKTRKEVRLKGSRREVRNTNNNVAITSTLKLLLTCVRPDVNLGALAKLTSS